MLDIKSLSDTIKEHAISLGFSACGISKAEPIDINTENSLHAWLNENHNADMEYLARNTDKRIDPSLLIEGGKSIISVALNYYPQTKQSTDVPQFAYYAYGKDYHEIVKDKLQHLLKYIQNLIPDVSGRVFCDTAPVMERYWAAKSGIGFIGKNTLLIIPKKGSYFFLGEVIIDKELNYDSPLNISCGKCTRCLEACPTKAIEKPYLINANSCISYQTIENKGEISEHIKPLLSNNLYGCDICQKICPWNRYSTPHETPELNQNEEFAELDWNKMEQMTVEDYQRIFKGSAVKRAKYSGLKRNLEALKTSKKDQI